MPAGPEDEASLAQMTAAGTAVSWHEAVGLVQQLWGALAAERGPSRVAPASVFVQRNGEIRIAAFEPATADSSVQALGEMLRVWLEPAACPMLLRLVVAQATSTPPFYTSAAQFSEALSHYEESSAQDLARGVYERYRNAGNLARGDESMAELPATELLAAELPAAELPALTVPVEPPGMPRFRFA